MENVKKLGGKVCDFINQHTKLCLIVVFVCAVLCYALVASLMATCTYNIVDEELYINMARSFFYGEGFYKQYEPLNYTCVLYSIVLSVSYFFYSPEGILFVMRLIGVLLMSSCMFPVYLLAKKAFGGNKVKAFFVSVMSLVVTEMAFGFYVIQENLCYPMFLWIAYMVYVKFSSKEKSTVKLDVGIVVLFALIYFVKTYAIVFAGAYFLYQFVIMLKEKRYKDIRWLFIQGIIFVSIIALGTFLINFANDFQKGTNHYEGQIKSILPITVEKVVSGLYGVFGYLLFPLFSMGILPVLLPVFNIKSYEEHDRRFVIFLTLTAVITAVECAVSVYIPEEAGKLFPAKVCVRYLGLLFMPYVVMALKLDKSKAKVSKWIYVITGGAMLYMLLYFTMSEKIAFSHIDSYLFIVLQKLTKKRIVILLVGLSIALGALLYLNKKGKIKDIAKTTLIGYAVCLIVIMPLNFFRNLQLSRSDREGTILLPEYCTIAHALNYKYDRIYAYNMNERTFCGVLNSDYIKYPADELDVDTKDQKVAVIIDLHASEVEITGAKKIELDTTHFAVYENDENFDKIHVNIKEADVDANNV